MKYRRKPIVIDAEQWFVNGDHSKDECWIVKPDRGSTTQFDPFPSEGKVVRYYRKPKDDGSRICWHCGNEMHVHGWIDSGGDGRIVCPGDWIVQGVEGEFYPVKGATFPKLYEPA